MLRNDHRSSPELSRNRRIGLAEQPLPKRINNRECTHRPGGASTQGPAEMTTRHLQARSIHRASHDPRQGYEEFHRFSPEQRRNIPFRAHTALAGAGAARFLSDPPISLLTNRCSPPLCVDASSGTTVTTPRSSTDSFLTSSPTRFPGTQSPAKDRASSLEMATTIERHAGTNPIPAFAGNNPDHYTSRAPRHTPDFDRSHCGHGWQQITSSAFSMHLSNLQH